MSGCWIFPVATHGRAGVSGAPPILSSTASTSIATLPSGPASSVWEGEDSRERRALTYGEFAADVDRLAGGLRHLGIGRGDVVAIYMPNLPETFAAFLQF